MYKSWCSADMGRREHRSKVVCLCNAMGQCADDATDARTLTSCSSFLGFSADNKVETPKETG